MNLLATIRPTAWDLPLFLHVLGAMALVGAAAMGVMTALVSGPPPILVWTRRLSFRTLLIAALPAFVVMRIGAEWMRINEFGSSGPNPHWLIVGYTAADGGGVLLIVGIVIAWFASRRGSPRLAKAAALIVGLALVGWIITAWAMGAKP